MTAMADDNSGGQQRQRMMRARKIGRRTTRGKDKSGWQTTTALGISLIIPPGSMQSCGKIEKLSLCKKTFFSNTVCLVEKIAPAKTVNVTFLIYQS
jgi:hypothetical protein